MRFVRMGILSLSLISSAIFIGSLSGISGSVNAQTAEEQAAAPESCVTDKCHSSMGKDQFVHVPVQAGMCDSCHKLTGKHTFEPVSDVAAMCYQCHPQKNTLKTVHVPVQAGMCTTCHSPHQSPNKFQLLNEPPQLCFTCHDEKTFQGNFVHGPVAVGGCTLCHNPHSTDNPRMLSGEINDVCTTCHADKKDALAKKFVHVPVQAGCTNCHNPHAANFRFNLPAEGTKELCLGCHVDKKDWLSSVMVKHGGVETERGCLACHDPHASDFTKQLVQQPMDLCLTCHDKALDTPKGKIMDMKTYLSTSNDHHGPIRQKDCSACHNPHGSDNFRILRKNFPPVFYAPFDPKNYELCFSCHEKTLVLDATTKTLTGFRNGDMNLHFKHVNKADKGRTCRACHDPHATRNPKHIRDAVPFGAWGLPINYTKTETGGQCSPGCHQTFRYDRKNPVKNR
ncbi:MAG: cytochrome C [Nitrospirales bacterium]|nr:cytochrome C [Nitrospirales bacterium]